MISPGDLVNCFATMSELRRVRNSIVAATALGALIDAWGGYTGKHAVAFIVAVVGSQVQVLVLSTKRIVVTVPRRRIILFKGQSMSDRERDVCAALDEEEP